MIPLLLLAIFLAIMGQHFPSMYFLAFGAAVLAFVVPAVRWFIRPTTDKTPEQRASDSKWWAFLLVLGIGTVIYVSFDRRVDRDPLKPAYPAVARDPKDWFIAVKADAKSARLAARGNNKTVLYAVSESAKAYRAQMTSWSPMPSAPNVFQVCGDLVIALAQVYDDPDGALSAYNSLEDKCRDAIIPPIR